jgi:hypothetical protein
MPSNLASSSGAIDDEAVVAGGRQEAAILAIADQRLVALLELPFQRGENRGAVGGIFFGSVPATVLAPAPSKFRLRPIHEYGIELGEQVTPPLEQAFFDPVFETARCEGRPPYDAIDPVIRPPSLGRPVRSAGEREEDGAFGRSYPGGILPGEPHFFQSCFSLRRRRRLGGRVNPTVLLNSDPSGDLGPIFLQSACSHE